MLIKSKSYEHKAVVPADDGKEITFKWHVQRGILKPRMSGFELASFVIEHMPAILRLGVFDKSPRVKAEFEAMFLLLATSKREAIDRILPWIRCVYHAEEDDVIHMSLFDKTEQPAGPVYFVMGGK